MNNEGQMKNTQESFIADGSEKNFETTINAISASQIHVVITDSANEELNYGDPTVIRINNGWRILFARNIRKGAIINISRKTPLTRVFQFNETSYLQLNELNDEFSILLHMIQELSFKLQNQTK